MKRDGLDSIKTAVENWRTEVGPKPHEGEDLQFVGIFFENTEPAVILNILGKAGLMGANQGSPHLKLIGQTWASDTRDRYSGYHLTFEDLNFNGDKDKPPLKP